jgi:hypothetical protein
VKRRHFLSGEVEVSEVEVNKSVTQSCPTMHKTRPCWILYAAALTCSLLALPVLAQPVPENDTAAAGTAAKPASGEAAHDTSVEAAPAGAPAHAPHRWKGRTVDDRVKAMSQALDLNPTQQSELKKTLEDQREQVRRLLNDPSVPAENRIGALRAINDQTVERIRGFLNEEQKKKYFPNGPLPSPGASQESSSDLEYWMNATTGKKK